MSPRLATTYRYRRATPGDVSAIFAVLEEIAPEIPVYLDSPEQKKAALRARPRVHRFWRNVGRTGSRRSGRRVFAGGARRSRKIPVRQRRAPSAFRRRKKKPPRSVYFYLTARKDEVQGGAADGRRLALKQIEYVPPPRETRLQ